MMNEPSASPDRPAAAGADQHQSALFAHLLLQQSNMAMLLLGKVPHPETGQLTKDIETARLFIDTVEMLETKTRGNLTSEESRLLKQTLTTLRLSFVEAIESPAAAGPGAEPAAAAPKTAPADKPADATGDDEQRKKFTKKY